jgi:hypothetical protein
MKRDLDEAILELTGVAGKCEFTTLSILIQVL